MKRRSEISKEFRDDPGNEVAWLGEDQSLRNVGWRGSMAVGCYTIEIEVEADLENNLLPSRQEIEQFVLGACKAYNPSERFHESYERFAVSRVTVTEGPIRTR
jgi:hypothetical protein